VAEPAARFGVRASVPGCHPLQGAA
jgi:hypothetical protein